MSNIKLFVGIHAFGKSKKIRSVWDEKKQKRYYCLNDVVKTLTNVRAAKNHLKKIRQRDEELAKNWNKLVFPLEMDTAGGKQKLMCTDADGLFLIMNHIRASDKAEPFKRWLARRKE